MAKVGRPTKYTKEMCDVLDGMGDNGEGMAEAAVAIGVSRETFLRWQEEHPEFSDAVKDYRQRSQAWWESQGRVATFGGTDGFNATSYIFNMKNRFRDDWNDKTTTELQGTVTIDQGDVVEDLKAFLDAKSDRSAGSPS